MIEAKPLKDRPRKPWLQLAVFFLLFCGGAFMAKGWLSKLFVSKSKDFRIVAKYETPSEGDQLILKQLKTQGADLEKPREVLHYLYVPTQQASHEAAIKLRASGFEVTERASADAASNPPNPWLVLARKITLVNPQTVREMRFQFEKLAHETRGDYDGWEAAAQP